MYYNVCLPQPRRYNLTITQSEIKIILVRTVRPRRFSHAWLPLSIHADGLILGLIALYYKIKYYSHLPSIPSKKYLLHETLQKNSHRYKYKF